MTPRRTTQPVAPRSRGAKGPQPPTTKALQRLLGFWNAVEVLNHFGVPSPSRAANVVAIRDDGDLPWPVPESDEWLVWHIVYLGIHPHRGVVDELLEHFRASPDPDSVPSRDDCCLASFVVDRAGIIVPGSGVLTGHAWAMGQLAANPQLRGLPEAERGYQERFADRHAATRCDLAAMQAEVAAVEAAIGWRPTLPRDAPIARARRMMRRRRKNAREDEAVRPESDVLSSFYLGDLARLARAADDPDRLPRGLLTYLSDMDAPGRQDIRCQRTAVGDEIRPQRFPAGRWPQPDGHHLALMQQVAVNRALGAETAQAGIFSVNGPPGTGKTTLLRDIVAAVVVERARVMLAYARPGTAFRRGVPIGVGGTSHPTHVIDARLRGFELLIASSNNGAVENITLELPRHDAVDPSLVGDHPDPFADHGARLARAREGDAALAWGLIAGVLGNRENRELFREVLWFDREASLRNELGTTPSTDEWKDACSAFRVASEKERWHRERAVATAALASEAPPLRSRILAAKDGLRELEPRASIARQAAEAAGTECRRLNDAVNDRERALDAIRVRPPRPGSERDVLRAWEAECGARDHAYREARETRDRALAEASGAVSRHQELRALEDRLREEVETAERLLTELDTRDRAASNPSRITVDDAFWELGEKQRQLSLPWSTPPWEKARAELFLAALRLHRAFVRAAGTAVAANLTAMMEVLRQPPSGADPTALSSVWTTLFLVVPVISTTFASAARMLHGMGPESLGWALIDEGGQASPQQAAGTIWRARRTIVIGDPLQIPPVHTLPTEIQAALRTEWRVADRWDPAGASVQTVADSLNPLGTSLGTTWVGCPLRVHRRCAEPMFAISNEIAYDGAMVPATPDRSSVIGDVLGESRWIDIPGVPGNGHHVHEQAVMVERMIRRLARTLPTDLMDVFVISPFRLVADSMREQLRSLAPADNMAWRQWVREHVGTIHTAQGREADAVILLLGGDPSVRRALLWAGATPNILNVAVSRAQERLYVVGDAAAWSTVPYFSTLHARLRVVRPAQRTT